MNRNNFFFHPYGSALNGRQAKRKICSNKHLSFFIAYYEALQQLMGL